MLSSLNFRLLLSHVFVILVCLALVGLGLLLFVRNSPLWTSAALLRLDAAARAAVPTLRQAGLERLPDALTQVAEEQEVRVLLLDSDSTVRFDSEGAWVGEQLEEVKRAQVVRERFRGAFVAPAGNRWIFVGQMVPAPMEAARWCCLPPPRGGC
jgi:hypothetical protein